MTLATSTSKLNIAIDLQAHNLIAGRVNGLEARPQISDALSYTATTDRKLGLAVL